MAYKILGECTATNNEGTTYTTLGDGAELSGTVQGGYGTMKLIRISTGGSVQSGGLYLAFATSATPGVTTSFVPCEMSGSVYYPLNSVARAIRFVDQSYTKDGIRHYAGYVEFYTVSTNASLYTFWEFDVCLHTVNTITVTAPTGCTITATPTLGVAATIAAGSTANVTIYGSSTSVKLQATLASGYTLKNWTKNGTAAGTTNPLTLTVSSGNTISCVLTHRTSVTVEIVAPSQSAIQYVCGNNGEQIAYGTVSAGAYESLALSYEDGTGGVTVVLTASSFNIDTFSGWTKDGVVVDRWSNPATIKAETSCTLSCAFGSTGGTSTGAILCDRYGAILYGDAGAASTSATIAISATYRDSGHTITWAIHKVGESEGAKSVDVTTALSVSKTLAWESGGSGSNMPLYADKKIAVLPKLFRVRFNCQVAEHVYDVTIKKNGATIYSETYLSGTFSRTFEL